MSNEDFFSILAKTFDKLIQEHNYNLLFVPQCVYEKGEFAKVWGSRKQASVVGLTSMLGSVGWFTAMTLQNAAYVRALGQVELIFTFFTSVLIFRERIAKAEIGGTLLIVSGVLILLLE